MNDTIGFIVVAVSLCIVTGFMGYLVFRYKNRADRQMYKIANDPALLLQELKKHGRIIDIGKDDVKEEIEFSYQIAESGDGQVIVNRSPIKAPAKDPPKPKPKAPVKGRRKGK